MFRSGSCASIYYIGQSTPLLGSLKIKKRRQEKYIGRKDSNYIKRTWNFVDPDTRINEKPWTGTHRWDLGQERARRDSM